MTLEQTVRHINTIVDAMLVKFAAEPESRYLITLPSLSEEEDAPVMDCQEYNYGIARLREILTYKYLLRAIKSKQLDLSRESLSACLRCLRQSPLIDYYDLGDYHELAYRYYLQTGQEKKARRHLLSCYMDRGRAIFSADKVFDSKALMEELLKEHRRMQAILMYIVSFVYYDMEEVQECLVRTQYLLLERAMVLAVKLMAENPACDKKLRSCVYFAYSKYLASTRRPEEARAAKKAYWKFAGKKKIDLVFSEMMLTQPEPQRSDELFLDDLLYGNSIEESDIYPTDEEGRLDFGQQPEDPIVVRDGRENFMDVYYRPMASSEEFREIYGQAEQGDVQAIREVARRYREGDGVTVCEAVAAAWEKLIMD